METTSTSVLDDVKENQLLPTASRSHGSPEGKLTQDSTFVSAKLYLSTLRPFRDDIIAVSYHAMRDQLTHAGDLIVEGTFMIE